MLNSILVKRILFLFTATNVKFKVTVVECRVLVISFSVIYNDYVMRYIYIDQ